MESQQHFRFFLYQDLTIILLLFAAIGIEVGLCDTNSDSNNSNKNPFCGSNQYLMTSYFKNHERLLDSSFQDFVENELHSGLCKALPDYLDLVVKQSVLQRHVIGEGSHRHLSTSIRFHIDPESISRLRIHNCEVVLVERLPSGVFADPFELQHLRQRGVFTDVTVLGDTNLELPSFRSNQSVVEIHMDAGQNFLFTPKNELEIKVELPLHARYQPLDESGYSSVKFGDPNVFLRCCIDGKPHNQSCLFTATTEGAGSKTATAVWEIPSGIKAHAGVVSVVTFIAASLSTVLIVLTSIFYSESG